MPRERSAGVEPRWITGRLGGAERTPRTDDLANPSPESNVEGGGVAVEATRTTPGGVATVEVPSELERHVDDDSHLRVDAETGEVELVEVEPVEPLVRGAGEPVEGAPAGSPAAPLDGPPEVDEPDNGPGSEGSLDDPGVAVSGLVEGRLVARPGTPGSFEPEVHGDDRPSSIAELNDRATVESDAPWPAGAWIGYGSGKRAHWHGAGFATGESPGYAPA